MSGRPVQDHRIVFALVLAAVGLVVVGVYGVSHIGGTKAQHACEMMLHQSSVNGETVALQDQGAPGHDFCDLRKSERWRMREDILDFDCMIRDSQTNEVVATTTPNRRDGTCGQPDP